jgi:DNA replication protein DnaC
MSAALNNLTDRKEFTQNYEALPKYYQLEGQKIQAGHAHENCDIEQRHYRFKQAVTHELMMRVSRQSLALMTKTPLEGEFLERRENVLGFGNPGSGKTHLLCAIG